MPLWQGAVIEHGGPRMLLFGRGSGDTTALMNSTNDSSVPVKVDYWLPFWHHWLDVRGGPSKLKLHVTRNELSAHNKSCIPVVKNMFQHLRALTAWDRTLIPPSHFMSTRASFITAVLKQESLYKYSVPSSFLSWLNVMCHSLCNSGIIANMEIFQSAQRDPLKGKLLQNTITQ